jgi:WD40 repeat protein
VKVWDIETGKEKMTLKGHEGTVWYVAWSPDGKTIASTGNDATVKLWDAETGKEIKSIKDDTDRGTIFSLKWSPDSKSISCNRAGGICQIWDIETGMEIYKDMGKKHCMAWSSDCKKIAFGFNNKIKIVDVSPKQ